MRQFLCAAALLGLLLTFNLLPADDPPKAKAEEPDWVPAMKQVHGRFTGKPGTLALFGDSITVSMAFWAPLSGSPKQMSPELAGSQALVKE